jgi:menaquinone-9 beta-reductase
MIYDVIVVGAGPGGSSTAAFLARRGVSTLLLDKASFPRDKVCGDGLTPQAIYWLERLGCVDEVLAATNACIPSGDLYINGEFQLSGNFPDTSPIYPGFCILLDRHSFDHILMRNALACGAHFEGDRLVREVKREGAVMRVLADHEGRRCEVRGRIVIGADGVSSTVSRAIGNTLKAGVTAVSVRTYYRDVEVEGSQLKVYFDRDFFPGYGWLFVDDTGFANIGLGYAFDPNFPGLRSLRRELARFLESDLAGPLAKATRCGKISGGAASFYKPRAIVADGVMLVGDAANQADPMNGGGIHKAMESAFFAAQAAVEALASGDFSRRSLGLYEEMWSRQFELDWRTAEFFLSIAKNPNLKDFCLFMMRQIGRLTTEDRQFQDFCSGVFSGVIAQSACLSPLAVYHAFPKDPAVWMSVLENGRGLASGTTELAMGAFGSLARAGGRMAARPLQNLDWGLEVATKALRLAECHLAARRPPPDLAQVVESLST